MDGRGHQDGPVSYSSELQMLLVILLSETEVHDFTYLGVQYKEWSCVSSPQAQA